VSRSDESVSFRRFASQNCGALITKIPERGHSGAAGFAREPGIQEHQLEKSKGLACVHSFRARPKKGRLGTTAEFLPNPAKGGTGVSEAADELFLMTNLFPATTGLRSSSSAPGGHARPSPLSDGRRPRRAFGGSRRAPNRTRELQFFEWVARRRRLAGAAPVGLHEREIDSRQFGACADWSPALTPRP
jgi:hypothetical protein